MKKMREIPIWARNPRLRWAAGTVLWIVLLITVAIPSWRGVIHKNQTIDEMEIQLATLDEWTVAGLWLAPSVAQRTLPVNAAFSRLYPSTRGREQVFLDLARIADRSGVEEFGLIESGALGLEANDVWNMPATMTTSEPGDEPPSDGLPADNGVAAAMTLDVPHVELSSYRIIAKFNADYGRAADFLAGLEEIERALKVCSLKVRPDGTGIQVEMELDVYVDQSYQS